MEIGTSTMVMYPVKGTLVDSKKGSVGNRMECAGAQAVNNVKCTVETAAVAGTTALGLGALKKFAPTGDFAWNTKLNKAIKNYVSQISKNMASAKIFKRKGGKYTLIKSSPNYKDLSKGAKFFANFKAKVANVLSTGLAKLAKTSGKQKLGIGLAVAGSLALIHTIRKYAFKSGQIDQKYNDRAKAQKLSV